MKAFAGDSQERQISVMCMLERWLIETEAVPTDLHSCFNQLYAAEVVTDDAVFERWFETPNLSRRVHRRLSMWARPLCNA